MNTIISTHKAPAAIGPYSQAVRAGNLIFCSGQIGIDPATKTLAGNDVGAQTRQIFKNAEAILEAAGFALANVVKTTVFLDNMGDFAAMNAVYEKMFGDYKPARSTVQVARLPLNALVEIEFIAVDDR